MLWNIARLYYPTPKTSFPLITNYRISNDSLKDLFKENLRTIEKPQQQIKTYH